MTQPAAPPPGWYADPDVPGRERWWTGSDWSKYRALASAWEPFGIAHARSMRLGANRHARAARAVLWGSAGTAFAMVWLAVFSSRWTAAAGWVLPLAIFTVSGAVVGVALASAALRRSPVLGARAVSVYLIATGAMQVLAVVAALLLWTSGHLTLD